LYYFVHDYYFFSVENFGDASSKSDHVADLVKRILDLAKELMPKTEDIRAEDIGDIFDQEMAQTSNAIEAAASRIAVRPSQLDNVSPAIVFHCAGYVGEIPW
jgi:hypothetical protein